jgi:hypothetical protein
MRRKVFIHHGPFIGEEGIFHQFGINFEEFDKGISLFTIAVVELESGYVISVPVDYIKFIKPEEEKA